MYETDYTSDYENISSLVNIHTRTIQEKMSEITKFLTF